MKNKKTFALMVAFSALALAANGQNNSEAPGGGNGRGGPGGMHQPLTLSLVAALDTNQDGIIDSNEIANAGTVLKTLDKNGDGPLTRDEYLGQPPPHRNNRNSPDGPGRWPDGGDNNMPPRPPLGDN